MRFAEPPVWLRPDTGTGWARALSGWSAHGRLVAAATAADWGTGRAGSRHLIAATLGHLLGREAAGIALARDDQGRPYPVHGGTGERLPVDVNLSHTGDLFVLGVSRAGRIGVDIERADRIIATGPSMLARFCHPAETVALSGVSGAVRTEAIARLWVGKEAIAKADGRGLAIGMPTVRVDRPPQGYRLGIDRLRRAPSGADYWVAVALREDRTTPITTRTLQEAAR
ncbi:4'-phosphopantetheinyl transferase superfamily protein [Saccharomonospora sp. NPDC046836]|uniref:4'-phosphopantetheinyl transferase family protein n=1 Tax=Saccharomonospora sp. NPDC046836 TaxID=3156921 RepID=UPI003407DC77